MVIEQDDKKMVREVQGKLANCCRVVPALAAFSAHK